MGRMNYLYLLGSMQAGFRIPRKLEPRPEASPSFVCHKVGGLLASVYFFSLSPRYAKGRASGLTPRAVGPTNELRSYLLVSAVASLTPSTRSAFLAASPFKRLGPAVRHPMQRA